MLHPNGLGRVVWPQGEVDFLPEEPLLRGVLAGGNCIKISLPGKSILRGYFQDNRTSWRPFLLLRISFPGRPIFIQFIPGDEDGPAEGVKRSVHARPEHVGLDVEHVVQPVRLPTHAEQKRMRECVDWVKKCRLREWFHQNNNQINEPLRSSQTLRWKLSLSSSAHWTDVAAYKQSICLFVTLYSTTSGQCALLLKYKFQRSVWDDL